MREMGRIKIEFDGVYFTIIFDGTKEQGILKGTYTFYKISVA